MFDKKNLQSLAMFVAIVVASYLAIIGFKCLYNNKLEYFKEFSVKSFKPNSCTSNHKKYYFTADEDSHFKFNGMLFKYKLDGKFKYMYKFNLPIPYGGDYNKVNGYYKVEVGKTKDDLKKFGELERSSDGWFYLEKTDENNYNHTFISFVNEDKGVKQVLFHKKL